MRRSTTPRRSPPTARTRVETCRARRSHPGPISSRAATASRATECAPTPGSACAETFQAAASRKCAACSIRSPYVESAACPSDARVCAGRVRRHDVAGYEPRRNRPRRRARCELGRRLRRSGLWHVLPGKVVQWLLLLGMLLRQRDRMPCVHALLLELGALRVQAARGVHRLRRRRQGPGSRELLRPATIRSLLPRRLHRRCVLRGHVSVRRHRGVLVRSWIQGRSLLPAVRRRASLRARRHVPMTE